MIRSRIDAARALSDTDEHHAFWFCDGSVLKNIEELYATLLRVDDSAYRYHANSEKNDFGNWINDVLGDSALAKQLRGKEKKEVARILKQRISWLERKAKGK